jgi:hypothetical protein
MRKLFLAIVFMAAAVAAGFYLTAKPVKCDDCNQGKSCYTSYDCGEIGVCYCQATFEEEDSMGTCYFE